MSESDGISFSFYNADTVAHSVILGAVPASFERERHGRNLVSFSLTMEDLQAGRELVSGGTDLPLDDEEEAETQVAEAQAREAAALTASRDAAFKALNAKREEGKLREANKKASLL